MTRTTFARLLLPLFTVVSCSRTTVRTVDSPASGAVPFSHVVQIGDGIRVPTTATLTTLPPGQRYRFVSPDSLVLGLSLEDIESAELPHNVGMRSVLAAAVAEGRWVASADSAAYDLTVFSALRTKTRWEANELLVTPHSVVAPPCNIDVTPASQCFEAPIVQKERSSVEGYTVYVLRRRADGATRVWRLDGIAEPSPGSKVAKDLRVMLRAKSRRSD